MEADPGMKLVQVPEDATILVFEATAEAEVIKAADEAGKAGHLLHVEPGAPLLSVERLAFTYGDQPVELRRGLYRTDRHYYRNELS